MAAAAAADSTVEQQERRATNDRASREVEKPAPIRWRVHVTGHLIRIWCWFELSVLSSSEGFPQTPCHIPLLFSRTERGVYLNLGFGMYAGGVLFILLFYLWTSIYVHHHTLSYWTSCCLTMIIEDAPVKITLLYTIYIQWQSDLVTVSTLIPYYGSPSFSSCKVWCFSVMTYSLILYARYIQIPKNIMDKRFHKYETNQI